MPLPKPLIRKIKALQSRLGMDDDTYRVMLSGYNVASSTRLRVDQAKDLIAKLEHQAIAAGVWEKPKPRPLKYAQYDLRPEPMATGRQLRMIDAMWKGVSRIPVEADRDKALDAFCKRITGVDKLIWIENQHVVKLVSAIKAMQRSQQRKKGGSRERKKRTG